MSPHDDERDDSELVRLNKFLADHGVASRRKCDEMIAAGEVLVDGHPETRLGVKIDPAAQRVEVDGRVLEPRRLRHRYYLLNKPSGVVCTNDERELRKRAIDLVNDRDKGRIYTVGRLDEDTVGLILLTDDGEFANRVMHPRYEVEKTYLVRVRGRIDDEALDQVRRGVHLAEGRTAGARIVVRKRNESSSTLLVTIREGKNREVRRVFARVGAKVIALKRTRIGTLDDRGLRIGQWRHLTKAEVEGLLALASGEGREEGEQRRPRGARRARPGGGPRSRPPHERRRSSSADRSRGR